jgi:hypothetical protein
MDALAQIQGVVIHYVRERGERQAFATLGSRLVLRRSPG